MVVSSHRCLQFGKASNYVKQIDNAPHKPVFIWIRGSTKPQIKNIPAVELKLRREMELCGRKVLGVEIHIGSSCPMKLTPIVEKAEKHDALVITETMCRYYKSDTFHPQKNPETRLREPDLKWLDYWTKGRLTTLHDPDLSPEEIKSIQTHRGFSMKGTGGRNKKKIEGKMKLRRQNFQELAIEWNKLLGMSSRTIQDYLHVEYKTRVYWTTIAGWIKSAG